MGRRGRPPGTPEPGSDPFGDAARAAQERAAAEQAASERAQAERAAQERAAAEHAELERAAQERAAAERAAQERAVAERAARERAEAERAAAAPSPEPTFEEIFGTPTADAPEPDLPRHEPAPTRPREPVASVQPDESSAIDALASAVGGSASQTPWATATSAAASTPAPPASSGTKAKRSASKPTSSKRRRSGARGGIVIIVAIVAILAGVVGGGWALFGGAIMDRFASPEDYEGSGTGEVVVRIEQGWTGAQVGAMLEEEGVIADQQVFYDLLLADPSIGFQPGSYRLANEMSSQAALDALQDEANRVVLQITIPEGMLVWQVYERLAEQTGIAEEEFVQAGADFAQFGIPADAVSLEGWLFPATYTFDDGATPVQMLQTMVDRMRQSLNEHGVAEADWQRTVTFASLVQREAGPETNFGRVARVFQNRLDIGMNLQSDATVAYGTGNTHLITTTDEEREDAGNPYNTYVHQGLPIGPIGAPGDAAIAAVIAPEEGDWLFFVTTNPDTGETVFSDTYDEHLVAVQEFQAWLREHPEYGG